MISVDMEFHSHIHIHRFYMDIHVYIHIDAYRVRMYPLTTISINQSWFLLFLKLVLKI